MERTTCLAISDVRTAQSRLVAHGLDSLCMAAALRLQSRTSKQGKADNEAPVHSWGGSLRLAVRRKGEWDGEVVGVVVEVDGLAPPRLSRPCVVPRWRSAKWGQDMGRGR